MPPVVPRPAVRNSHDTDRSAHQLADQLAARVATLIGAEVATTAQFGIAVSGGPDSLALLLLAAQAFPGRVVAATVDHGLRPESPKEAAFVAEICAARAIPHSTLRPETPITGTLQASARTARYALLNTWRVQKGVDWLMTAHHADDQLETMVMRLNRASGVGGLAGIRARHGHILRPLLSCRRATLAAWLAEQGQVAIDDPSNANRRFDRVRVRQALADQSLLDPQAVAASADRLADAETALEWMAAQLMPDRFSAQDAGANVSIGDLPTELQRRLLLAVLHRLDPAADAPRGDALTRALIAWAAGGKAMIGDWLISPAPRQADMLRIRPAPPRRNSSAAAHS